MAQEQGSDKKFTGTDVLIQAMEEVGASDSQDIIVLIRDSNGSFSYMSNIDSIMDRLGILTFALERQKYLVMKSEE